jgi:hypothetical protein
MSGDDLICAPCAPVFYVHQICPFFNMVVRISWLWKKVG